MGAAMHVKFSALLLMCFSLSVFSHAHGAADDAVVEKNDGAVTGGIARLLVSVTDMDASLAFYRDWVGLNVVADQFVGENVLGQLWGLPAGTKARSVVLQKDAQPTLLELIEFQPRSDKPIREKANLHDFGLYDITFIVRDNDTIHRKLTEKGFAYAAHGLRYPPGLFPFDIQESILLGPDFTPITHMQMLGPETIKINGNYSGIKASTQIVEHTQEAIVFYRDILGLTLRSEAVLPKGLLDKAFSLPGGTEAKMAFFNKDGSASAMLATLELSVKGRPLSARSGPPHIGLFMLAFETDDLSVVMKRLKKHCVLIVRGPAQRNLEPYGNIRLLHCEGPSGIRTEIFERLNDQ